MCFQFSRVRAKSLQSCPALCSPVDRSPPGSSVHGILQARMLEWVSCSSPRDLPDPQIKPVSFVSPAPAGRSFTTSMTWVYIYISGSGIAGSYDTFMFNLLSNAKLFSKATELFTFLPAIYGGSNVFASLSTVSILCPFTYSHPPMYEMIYPYGLDLHFSNN